jgi:hypothetical protein
MTSPGYLYILFNSAMPNLVKIGQTTRDPSQRAREIGGTGVPGDFAVAYEERVPDCSRAERRAHRELAQYRYNPKREFFRIALKDAIETVRRIAEHERAMCPPAPAPRQAQQLPPLPGGSPPQQYVREQPLHDVNAEPQPHERLQWPLQPDASTSLPLAPESRPPPVVRAVPLSWGILSGLLGTASVGAALMALVVVIVAIDLPSRSRSSEDLIGQIFASLVVLAAVFAIMRISWKGAHMLRRKGF